MPVRSREIHSLSSRIQLPVLRKLLSIMDGQHSALRHGRGWEFLDLAPYQPGDDVRSIDWPATVRTGSPVIKRREPRTCRSCSSLIPDAKWARWLPPVKPRKRWL